MHTKRDTIARAAILLSTGVAGLALGSAVDGSAGKALVAKLRAKHGSGISGTATLHIHTGPCRREPTFANPRISSSLNYVVKRKSVTTVTLTTLASLRKRSYSINVHDPGTYGVVACADIPRAS